MLIGLLASGCVSNSVLASKSDCSQLVPSAWKAGVASTNLPAQTDDERERLNGWINFGVRQTGQLEKANDRTADALGIIERCEKRDREAIERAKPKFLGIF